MQKAKWSSPEKWILWGILVLSLVGSSFHFIYQLSGNNLLVGIIAPINESVWEHNKMALWPMLFWWGGYFLVRRKKDAIDPAVWFTALLGAIVFAMLFMTVFFYTYSGATGVESLGVDIVDFLLAMAGGQLFGLWLYHRKKRMNLWLAAGLLAALVAVFTVFTFVQPDLPLFIPHEEG